MDDEPGNGNPMKCNCKLHFPTQRYVCSSLWFWRQLGEGSRAGMGPAVRTVHTPTERQGTVCGLLVWGPGEAARVMGCLFSPHI